MHFIIQIRIPVSSEFGVDSETIRDANIVYHFPGNLWIFFRDCYEGSYWEGDSACATNGVGA